MEPNEMTEPQKTVSIEILDVHLDYMRKDIQTVLKGMSNMATTDDIKKLSERMDKFATIDRVDALEKKIDASTIGNAFDRWIALITKLGAAGAVLSAFIGLVYTFVHFSDKISLLVK